MVDFLIGILNLIIAAFGSVLSFVLGILPNSPFTTVSNLNIPFLDSLAWIVPFDLILAELQAWLVAIVAYYVGMVVLRWVKALS